MNQWFTAFTKKKKILKSIFHDSALPIVLVTTLIFHIWVWQHSSYTLTGDMIRYDQMARHLVYQHYLGFGRVPDAYVTPGYPLFVAGLYELLRVFGLGQHSQISSFIRFFFLIQQLFTVSITWVSYALARRLANFYIGIAAAWLSVFYLPNAFIGSMMLTEALYIPVLLLVVIVFVDAQKKESIRGYMFVGLILGLATLVRPTAGILLPLWALLIWLKPKAGPLKVLLTERFATVFPFVAALILGFVITMIPWWVRNLLDFHHFIFLSSEAGNPLLQGSDPYFHISLNHLLAMALDSHWGLQTYAIRRIWHGFTHHFWYYLGWYTIGKIPPLFYSPWLLWFFANSKAFIWVHRLICVLGGLSAVVSLRRLALRPLAATSILLTVVQFAFLPIERYVYPVIVLWCVLIPLIGSHYLSRISLKLNRN